MKSVILRLLMICGFIIFTVYGCLSAVEADTIYINGQIWTGTADDAMTQAIAIKGDRIMAVGTNAEINSLKGSRTKVVDLKGRFVTPGFIDSHTHFLSGGYQLGSVDLRYAASQDEFARKIAQYIEDNPGRQWITGGDWDHEMWGGELPQAGWIDAVTEGRYVFISRLDGHMALANSATLALANISADTPDPDGGTIVRAPETGLATGILKDAAMNLVWRVMPDDTPEEDSVALDLAMAHALSRGVTQVYDMGLWSHLQAYRHAHESGGLNLRIYAFVPISLWQRLADFIQQNGTGDSWLRWGGVKGFVDGSLGSTTAWFYDPYLDAPETSGLITTDTTALARLISDADSAGLHVAVHAIGDRANDWLLDTYAAVATRHGPRDRRFRIEHAQHLSAAAIPRFATQSVIPAMQPYHAIDDGRWAHKRIGPERIKTTYAFRSLLDTGARLSLGSDWTVAPIDPLLGIYAAVTRRTLDGANPDGWVPDEKITVREALRGYTSASAYSGFVEGDCGSLKPGNLADFVVLSENLFHIAPEAIRDVTVVETYVGGIRQYSKDAAAGSGD